MCFCMNKKKDVKAIRNFCFMEITNEFAFCFMGVIPL